MERIDLFVKVMSLKETSPLLFLENLINKGSDFTRSENRKEPRTQSQLGW